MKRIATIKMLLVISIAFVNVTCKNENVWQSGYRSGNFILADTITKHVHIIRNDSMQYEYNLNTGAVTENFIKWENDSSYILYIYKTDNNLPDSDKRFRQLTVSITEYTPNGYKYRSKFKGVPGVYYGELLKVDTFPCLKK